MGSVTHIPVVGRRINKLDYAADHVIDLDAGDLPDHDHDDRYYTETEIDALLATNCGANAPTWLTNPDAIFAINYMLGEAWDGTSIITDLTTILGGSFDPARLSIDGYDQTTNDLNPPSGGMVAEGALLTRLQAMDWSVRVEWDQDNMMANGTSCLVEGWEPIAEIGWEMTIGAMGNFVTSDYEGEYNEAGIIGYPEISSNPPDPRDDPPVRNYAAASNNVDGWACSLNGAAAVISAPQSLPADYFIGIGTGVNSSNMPWRTTYGSIRIVEFFPLKTAAELAELSVYTGPHDGVPAHDHDGRYYTKDEADDLFASELLVPANVFATSYTIQPSDRYAAKALTNAALVTITVPNNTSIPVGARCRFCVEGAGGAVVAEAVGVTIINRGNKRNAAQGSIFELHKRATATWWLLGDVQ